MIGIGLKYLEARMPSQLRWVNEEKKRVCQMKREI